MRITVFGATGRTGRPPVRQALDRGHDVVVAACLLVLSDGKVRAS